VLARRYRSESQFERQGGVLHRSLLSSRLATIDRDSFLPVTIGECRAEVRRKIHSKSSVGNVSIGDGGVEAGVARRSDIGTIVGPGTQKPRIAPAVKDSKTQLLPDLVVVARRLTLRSLKLYTRKFGLDVAVDL